MISILLAVYNGEKYLRRSIESVLNQSYKDFEILIGFNGTIDKSKDIVSEFNDSRIKIFDFGLEAGKSKTLNKLLKESKGEWIAIQDDDDIWLPNKLEIQMDLAISNNYDVIGSRIFYCDELEKIIGTPNISLEHQDIVNRSLNGDNQIPNTSAVFRKEKAIQVNGWDEALDELSKKGYQPLEDFDFWLKLIKKKCIFVNDSKPLVFHRLHNGSNFNTKKNNIKELIQKYK
jgi:glycosyltransferase involved in cell wall biosynthesis